MQVGEGQTVVAVSDIHGYLDETVELLEQAWEQTDIDPLFTYDAAYTDVAWTGGDDYVFLCNGDLIDRGPQSAETLDFLWALQDDAERQGHGDSVVATVGNSEAYALQPDNTLQMLHRSTGATKETVEADPETYYWWHMDDEQRDMLQYRIQDGDMPGVFQGHHFRYTHAGQIDDVSVAERNAQVQAAASDDNLYEKTLRKDAGVMWTDFGTLLSGAEQPQVVGHTPAAYTGKEQTHPHQYGDIININTMVDYMHGRADHCGLLVEEPDDVYGLVYDGETVEQRQFDLPRVSHVSP